MTMTYALTQPTPAPRTGSPPLLQWLLYGLAVVVLVLGLWAGLGLMSFAASLTGLLPMLQALGSPALSNLVGSALRQGMTTLGLVTVVLAVVLSALLFTAGKLLGRVRDLSDRVAHLEAGQRPSPTAATGTP